MSRKLYTNFKWGLTGELQSMLVEAGRVLARGQTVAPTDAHVVDLNGKHLLPALTDCHLHILPTGLDLERLYLGHCDSIEAVLDAVRLRHHERPDGWLTAVHYDQNRWDGTHLTRHELDSISADRPILLRHVNGHAGVANSAALKATGIGPSEPDPKDGSYGRNPDGTVNGVLFEGAHERAYRAQPEPTVEEAAQAILKAGQSMATWGLGLAVDMQTERRHLHAYLRAVELGCPIKMRLYMVWRDVFGPRAADSETIEALKSDSLRVAGVKLFADGAIGSATAAIYGPYVGRDAKPDGTSGQLMYTPEVLADRVRIAHDRGYQVAIHAIGDFAFDLVMDAFQATGEPQRHRVEHAMLLSDAQIERLAEAGTSACMQPEFLVRFGHAYKAQLGPQRSSMIKRFRSVLDAGIPLAFSSDRPICAGNPWDGVACASNRPEGYSEAENLTRVEALERYLAPARAINGDDGGYLLPGEEAVAITMESDPLLPGTPAKLAFLQD